MATQGEISNVDRKQIPEMLEGIADALDRLRKEEMIASYEIAGSYRRLVETVNDVDIIIFTECHEYGWGAILGEVSECECVKRTTSLGQKKATLILETGLQVDLYLAKPEEAGTMLLYFTGSPFFNIALRARAKKMGLKLNERGLYDETDRLVTRCNTETVILAELGLEYIPASERSVNHTDWSTAHKLFARHKIKKD
jgi:DNA polymerase (family 10)